MADLSSGLDKLPPAERLKRLRAIEAEKRKELAEDLGEKKKQIEAELAKRKKELDELEHEAKRDIAETEELETKTLEEMTRERSEHDAEELEKQVRKFTGGSEFVPEGESLEEQARRARPGAGGFGQQVYHSEAFSHAEANIAYLMNSANPMSEARREATRELYRSVRALADEEAPAVERSYVFNKLQQQIEELKTRAPEQDGYVNHIASFLNSVVDYRRDDERRRAHR